METIQCKWFKDNVDLKKFIMVITLGVSWRCPPGYTIIYLKPCEKSLFLSLFLVLFLSLSLFLCLCVCIVCVCVCVCVCVFQSFSLFLSLHTHKHIQTHTHKPIHTRWFILVLFVLFLKTCHIFLKCIVDYITVSTASVSFGHRVYPRWYFVLCAESLRSCPTLCNPMDCSLPGSSVLGDSPGKNTRVGCLQGIFPTQGSYPGLLHCRCILYHLSHQGSPLWYFRYPL